MIKTGKTGTILKTAGIFLFISVLLLCVPLTVPRALGWQIYAAIDFNYGPKVSEGSLIYVEPYVGEDTAVGDMVTYYSAEGGGVALRLVQENRYADGEIDVTDGLGNSETVAYAQVMGRVVVIIPWLGVLMSAVATRPGAAGIGGAFILGLIFLILGEKRKKAACGEVIERSYGGKAK